MFLLNNDDYSISISPIHPRELADISYTIQSFPLVPVPVPVQALPVPVPVALLWASVLLDRFWA